MKDSVPRYAVILAAGKGTRFKSSKPKVMHEICGKPMITYLLDRLPGLNIEKTFVVVDAESDSIRATLAPYDLEFVVQEKQLGTGHAVACALNAFRGLDGNILVLYGDTPFVETSCLAGLLESCESSGSDQALLTAILPSPTGYGRIIRDESGNPADIVEEKDASDEQKKIREINAGFACFKISALSSNIEKLGNSNKSGEYYLTDMVRILSGSGHKVTTVEAGSGSGIFGINDRLQLADAEKQVQKEILESLMTFGVTIRSPGTVSIDQGVECGPDTIIETGAVLEGKCRIGCGCVIGPHSRLVNAEIGDNTVLENGSIIKDSKVGSACTIGPFAHIRNDSAISNRVRIGNFVEIKNSTIGDETIAAHLSYLGDSIIGASVTIGAGTITCNFDGKQKNVTRIEDQAFIGSNCQIIAPVTIGERARVAAGSTITSDVPPGSLAIARSRQTNLQK